MPAVTPQQSKALKPLEEYYTAVPTCPGLHEHGWRCQSHYGPHYGAPEGRDTGSGGGAGSRECPVRAGSPRGTRRLGGYSSQALPFIALLIKAHFHPPVSLPLPPLPHDEDPRRPAPAGLCRLGQRPVLQATQLHLPSVVEVSAVGLAFGLWGVARGVGRWCVGLVEAKWGRARCATQEKCNL